MSEKGLFSSTKCLPRPRHVINIVVTLLGIVSMIILHSSLRNQFQDNVRQSGQDVEVQNHHLLTSRATETTAVIVTSTETNEVKSDVTLHIMDEIRKFGGKSASSYFPAGLSNEQLETLLLLLRRAFKERKYILRWTDGKVTGPTKTLSKMCGHCVYTFNSSLIDHPETKAVVIQFQDFNMTSLQKLNRRTDQHFVWLSEESPASLFVKRGMSLSAETEFKFNLTWSYRRDSDIYTSYASMTDIMEEKIAKGIHKNISSILAQKTRLAVAVISNCKGTTGAKVRLDIVRRMKSLGLDIDTFGTCFNKMIKERKSEFWKKLVKYKFYLAFENAIHCRDYITEKFFMNGYAAGTVPVALGARKAEYEAVAPKNSFIFVEDFTLLSSLVNYLRYLDENDEEYLKYFRWIESGRSSIREYGRTIRLCRLCRMINGINVENVFDSYYNKDTSGRHLFADGITTKTVVNLTKWFYESENKDCFRNNIYKIKRLLGNTIQ